MNINMNILINLYK